MKITAISAQERDKNRVNIFVDGAYRFSLDVFQLVDLGIKVGAEFTDDELRVLESESEFGKLYARALDYVMMRPHSAKEVRDYLWRKTLAKKYKSKRTGDIVERPGVPTSITERVFSRLVQKNYIDDESFARWWVENRNQVKGTSQRKLRSELAAKGISSEIVDQALMDTSRSDLDELTKILKKKRHKYPDENKLIAYLARQGFRFDDIKQAILSDEESSSNSL